MNRLWLGVVALALAGCSGGGPDKAAPDTDNKEAKIEKALAKLSDEDRKLAEAQRFCPVMPEKRLGAMGTPVKLELNGQTVFLCCKGCTKGANADPDKTLEKVKELKAKAAAGPDAEPGQP